MDFPKLGLGIMLATLASSVVATPQYTGNTTSETDLVLDEPGYFLWNDANSPRNWSLRWTAPGVDQSPVYWFGDIRFANSNLGDVSSFKFETPQTGGTPDNLQVTYGGETFPGSGTFVADDFTWTTSYTNNQGGVDGIDFTLNDDVELMELVLGSSLFTMPGELNDSGVPGQMIYIGENYQTPNNVLLTETGQKFEIAVPEPGTFALLGVGLMGLGAARRRSSS